MKRQSKFRGKRLDNGEWVTGDYTEGSPDHHYITRNDGSVWQVDPATVGEFSGIPSREGQEMAEDDIIRIETSHSGAVVDTVVVFKNGMFCYDAAQAKTVKNPDDWKQPHDFHKSNWWSFNPMPLTSGFYGYGNPAKTTIIGNLHDNPDYFKS